MCDQGGSGGSTEGVKGVAPKSDVDAASGEGGVRGVAQGVSQGGPQGGRSDVRAPTEDFLLNSYGLCAVRQRFGATPLTPSSTPLTPHPPPPPGVRGFILLKTTVHVMYSTVRVFRTVSASGIRVCCRLHCSLTTVSVVCFSAV